MENTIEGIIKNNSPVGGTAAGPGSRTFKLHPEQISSEVFIISPTQINYIAELFANSVADAMNMRAFAPKIRHLAEKSLRTALQSAKKQGA